MQWLKRRGGRTAAVAGLALLVAACTDRASPLGPEGPGTGPKAPPGTPILLQALQCSGAVATGVVECAAAEPAAGAAAGDLIVGGQNVYVRLSTSNVNYNAGLERLTFDATLRNLIPQPLGTTDGVALDPGGVRVFFHSGPVVTGGTGTITVVPDGTATFTAAAQPYYQYNQVLDQFELSPVRQWRLDMPSTVTDFAFTLYVSAPVQFPNGWIDLQPAAWSMPALAERQISAVVRSAVGNVDPAAVTFASGDLGTATTTAEGLVTGVRAGNTTITASSSLGRTGAMSLNISGIRRTWTGAADTEWQNGANWSPVGVLPATVDTAVVPGDLTNYPLFTSNNTIGGVIMQAGTSVQPTIDLGMFDFTLTASIDHGATGQIVASSGRMIFTGTAQTINGGVSNVDYRHARFTGTYTLNANLNVTGGRIVVQGGRLRNTSFRIRVRPS